ncbi:serine/threonine-protein kinase [Litorihabitans aurantiacus]|uniref:non-specific serine/threonine protein kinase n=1 Tax=Litorihabitans aurantiacus TaxID=1930061 RepID=A0AA37UU40_9MICO|nr:serine/threonine-protein kinase [Litorihabitans aurantiacus]GMA30201.1 serine/threonine-protein kinase PknG [Litorihabitans aurantiacus]
MSTATTCTQPGCTGQIEDGYCNVCGSPAGAAPLPAGVATAPAQAGGSPQFAQGTGLRPAPGAGGAGGGGAGGGGAGGGGASSTPAPSSGPGAANLSPASSRVSTRTSSSRLETAAIGSARGSRTARRTGTSSTRLRGHRIGAGLTTVPPTPVADPLQAIMATPELAESKRFCPSCGAAVGRSRDGVVGRTQGFCAACGSRYDFDPTLGPGDLVGGQYEVVGALAHGGLGWIYLARDQNVSGRWVVLKGLLNAGDKDAYEAAIAEREFLAEVEHPLIVEIYNFALHDGAGYTVMEYVGGKSLKEILTDRREANNGVVDPLPVDQALAYVLEILPAFSYLHDHNLLYCDFKPDNMIQQGERLKLIDLGGVRRANDETSAIFGTVGYQAPEVPTDGPTIASDIYTIGRTLATMVLDFRGNTSTYVASLPPVADTPVFQQYDSFYRLVAKACAPDAADRFAAVDELRTQVVGVLREVVATNRGPGSPALHSSASVHFEAPMADSTGAPLGWDELPVLKVDPTDPMANWLAGINDPVGRLNALQGAAQDTVEVRLARIHAAIGAGRFELAQEGITALLNADPWEWRAVWLAGLREMAMGDVVAARASFNAVYGQVPGELAPKLALATTCELSGEVDVAEQMYVVCARSDANFTAPSAFGLARIRAQRSDAQGTLHALDLVAPTRASYPVARVRRAGVLVNTSSTLGGLDDALTSIKGVPVEPALRADLEIAVYTAALTQVLRDKRVSGNVGGVVAKEQPLRLALEAAYRRRARMARGEDERIDLVDRANAVRPRTTT